MRSQLTSRTRFDLLGLLPAFIALLFVAGCASAPDAPEVPRTGFLQDYSELRPGRGNEAQLIYIDLSTNFSVYERVVIDPVVLWRPGSSRFSGVEADVQKLLTEALAEAFEENMSPDFEVVSAPLLPANRSGTLRIRMAITAARGARSDSGETFIGVVAIEIEVLDAATGKRLAAAVDTRSADPGSGANEREVREAFAEWASQARNRLAALRAFDDAHWGEQGS